MTDRRTDILPRHSPRYAYASRGKNRDLRPISRFISEIIQNRAYLLWNATTNSYASIEWWHFQWPWKVPNPDFKFTPLFDAEVLRNCTKYLVRTGTYWSVPFRMILNDWAKYTNNTSIARSLCDCWASCLLGDLVIRLMQGAMIVMVFSANTSEKQKIYDPADQHNI